MAQILLVHFDELTARRLAEFLETRGHRVNTLDPAQSLEHILDDKVRGFDLVILDVSVQCRDAGKLLEGLKRYRDAHGPRPMTLCVSRVYRGPRFELDLEQQGARVVYVS